MYWGGYWTAVYHVSPEDLSDHASTMTRLARIAPVPEPNER